jgi:hypothetical protein
MGILGRDINAWGPEGATWWALHPGPVDDDPVGE